MSELLKSGIKEAKFWQDKNLNEIDIILGIRKPIPVEIKFKDSLKPIDLKNLKVFAEAYGNAKGFLISLSRQGESESICFLVPYVMQAVIAKAIDDCG